VIKYINPVSWWFFPRKYLFQNPYLNTLESHNLEYKIFGWENIELVADEKRLEVVNKATGIDYLGGSGNEFLVPLFGRQSVFTLDFERHQLARKLISQALSRKRVDQSMDLITNIITTQFLSLKNGDVIKAGVFSRETSMSIASLFILSPNLDVCLEKELFIALEKATGFRANIVSYNKWLWSLFITKSVVKKVDTIVERVVDNNQTVDSEAVLHVLLKNRNKYGYDMSFIRDNIVSSLSAGYDTTGSALTWMMFWLAKSDNYDRIKKHYGREDYDAVIESFVLETLRYCPPLEILPRRQSMERKGSSLVCPCPHIVQHDPHRYINPEIFDPFRFFYRKPRSRDFLAFGSASRVCLGAYLAKKVLECSLRVMVENDIFLNFEKKDFKPIRRNVSLWPSFLNKALVSINERNAI